MKKIIGKISIGCCCVLALGIILTIIGLLQGGTIAYAIYPKEKKVYTAGDTEINGGSYREEVMTVEDFDSLEIDVDSADVEVKQGDGYQVSYYLQENAEPSVVVKNGTLQVSTSGEKNVQVNLLPLAIGNFRGKEEKIVVTLPAEKTLKNVEIQSDYGDVTLQNVNMEKLELNADSGDVVFSQVTLGSYNLTCDYGDVSLTNSQGESGNIKADSGDVVIQDFQGQNLSVEDSYGDVTITGGELDNLELSCQCGDADVTLNGTLDDYALKITVDTGDFKLKGKEQGTPYEINEGKDKKISISDDFGDISLEMKE